MESALGWVGDLVRWLANLIPHMMIVRKTHGGVAFVRGKNVREIKPGLVWWWPLWTECLMYPVVRQSLNLPSQSLTTADDKTVTASGVLIYQVSDVVQALSTQHDLNETIRDLTMAAMRDALCSSPFKSINQNRKTMDRKLTKDLVPILLEYGVEVLDFKLTDFAQSRVITVVNGGIADGITPIEEQEETE